MKHQQLYVMPTEITGFFALYKTLSIAVTHRISWGIAQQNKDV
jgi:hypothetical protein